MAKVLKAKYFPNHSLSDAKQKQGTHYSWRSILNSRWVIKKGSFWSMGNGNKINIWEDHWLPEQNGFKVLSKKPNNNVPIKVSNLINKTTNNWKEPIIHNLFLPFKAFQIKQIPITGTNAEDELVWASSQDGNYSVKTGYYAIQN